MLNKSAKEKAINVVTLGCSKNIVDSEVLLKQLESNGISVVHNAGSFAAKTAIINTCGFIKDAKQESIDTILQFIRAKEKGILNHVFVIGCLSQRYKSDLEKEIPNVDKYFGINNLESIISFLGLNYHHELLGERILTSPKHYAYLKVSEGCDRTCSFCAIPLIRGRHISKSMEDLVREAELLVRQGVKELILIAQDLTWYGMDLYGRQALPELLERLSDIREIEWIRMHYLFPAGFPTKELIRVMKERDNICKYLDIPFQHASNQVLRKMHRGHNNKNDIELINYIRSSIPGITLRTTLMTGHPGEGEKEFAELRHFVEHVKFDRLGIFTYSEEENTWSANHYKDSIPEKIKKERAAEIMMIQQKISGILNNNKIGRSIKVLIDDRVGEYYIGRSESDSPEVDNEVLIPVVTNALKTGQFYNIKITQAEEFDLYGNKAD
jgi:ribosomal protein S12 methylthiotransferase